MIYRCKFCPKLFPDEKLTKFGTIPKHLITRGKDTVSCKGGGLKPR